MTSFQGRNFAAEASRYIRPHRTPQSSWHAYLRWAAGVPFASLVGAIGIRRHVDDRAADVWEREFSQRRVLIVGSGPSLDKVSNDFFEQFDTFIYINFAARRRRGIGFEYFFSTDVGPVREFMETFGDDLFQELGAAHCIYAPIFLDQWRFVTPEGRRLFTWLRYDRAEWRTQQVKLGPIKLPLVLRYHPRQPDWATFRLSRGGRVMPVLDHTSALTAILFAASNGATDVGLIGCDFSAGRASIAGSNQDVPKANIFAGAAGEFQRMKAALEPQGVTLTNHSWLV